MALNRDAESTLELSVPADDAPMNSTGIEKCQFNESPIKIQVDNKNDEEWLKEFLDVMDSEGDDESK